ncbi:chemotaxis protein CheA [Clostridium sp. PL3]|uniref:Chemotaxis protein CheA n=1 Tax=Clostridium thailandense TaxID=2794346 RepID=A0A949TXS3_9CLOT|nr:chemotaxis protein CheA [Clostridium thailandense]MBV7273811.1 chemotaxis protein CheA [Clostridium thailandense]
MAEQYVNDPMLEVFIFETSQQLEQLEQCVINSEADKEYSSDTINEIFRIMHTIKSSSAMMLFNNISKVAHSTEDLFYFIREGKAKNIDKSSLCDLVLESIDFIKIELEKIKNRDNADGLEDSLIENITNYLEVLKQNNNITVPLETNESTEKQFYIPANKLMQKVKNNMFKAEIFFQDGCEMENIRAFTVIHNLKDITDDFYYIPEDIIENNDSCEAIRKEGFKIYLRTDKIYKDIENFLEQITFLDRSKLTQLENEEEYYNNKNHSTLDRTIKIPEAHDNISEKEIQSISNNQTQSIISVNVGKLDKLMDLVGELVIAEAMVTQNTDLAGLTLDNFHKASGQLNKITSEIQDMVMSIRMVPIGNTLLKMNRIIRDMSKKLGKEIHLDIIGEDTEVDKNVIEHIGDPLMHIIRNAVDHGIETVEERIAAGKKVSGTITLEAKNEGSEVLIIIKDDGRGLNKDKIIFKAMQSDLLQKSPEDMSDKEIFNLIFLPGFSTKDKVTEFSGRGVGMDVVIKNIEAIGGIIQTDSIEGKGTTITLKIPLTLAIIDGMNIKVGKSRYTLPIVSIKQSFRPKENDVFKDPDGNEMIMIRGKCYPILRLHKFYKVKTEVTDMQQGIIIVVENESKTVCIFVDELIGKQQVVVKPIPNYINNIKKIKGLAGCTLLGDGSISLILAVNDLIG